MWAKKTELTSGTKVMPINVCEIKKMGCGVCFFTSNKCHAVTLSKLKTIYTATIPAV
jgi:hypothetical protein